MVVRDREAALELWLCGGMCARQGGCEQLAWPGQDQAAQDQKLTYWEGVGSNAWAGACLLPNPASVPGPPEWLLCDLAVEPASGCAMLHGLLLLALLLGAALPWPLRQR